MSYLTEHGTRQTHQSEQMRSDQVENSAGGFVWAVDPWTRLRRFLILGSEGGSYYASQHDLTKENVKVVRELVASDGVALVDEIVSISESGRAPKNDPALYALACAISLGDKQTKRAAAEALPRVARIGTHLYHFVAYAETMRGWGRTMRWAVSNWYERNPSQLALQAVKYRQRDGWSHRDLLRLAHPTTEDANLQALYGFMVGSSSDFMAADGHPLRLIEGFEAAQRSGSPAETAKIVREYGLPREALITEHLNSVEVWNALLEQGMPMTAMIRNLATMTRQGVFKSREHLELVTDAVVDEDALRKARVHPLAILVAQRTYAAGRGHRGTNTWAPLAPITDALDEAFYLAFENVAPTGKRILLALDISGSMNSGSVCGSPLTPREASAAMALVTLHAERDVEIVGFCNRGGSLWRSPFASRFSGWSDGLLPLNISRRQRLDDVVRYTRSLDMGGTDCALPFLYALDNGKKYDAFVVYTDSETWAGNIHPKQALDKYRQISGIAARSAVVGMVANNFTIADPNDSGMLDVVGMDTATPAIISDFIAGSL